MRALCRGTLALAAMLLLELPAFAQPGPVGNVTIKVHNTFGSSVGHSFQQCAGCSFSPSPPTSVSNNTTSSAFTETSTSYNSVGTVRYGTYVGSQLYECQFQAPNIVGSDGLCGTASPLASASAGVYPSPHCTVESSGPVDPSTCNYPVTFKMAP